MKLILTILFLLISCTANAQQAPVLKIIEGRLAFDVQEGNNASEAGNDYIYYVWINDRPKIEVTAGCTGTVKPFECSSTLPELGVGTNIIYISFRHKPIGTAEQPESPRSNPLLIFHGVNYKEVIKETTSQLTVKCIPGTYLVSRITDAAKLQAITNAITKRISNILATANAIYIFSCDVDTSSN